MIARLRAYSCFIFSAKSLCHAFAVPKFRTWKSGFLPPFAASDAQWSRIPIRPTAQKLSHPFARVVKTSAPRAHDKPPPPTSTKGRAIAGEPWSIHAIVFRSPDHNAIIWPKGLSAKRHIFHHVVNTRVFPAQSAPSYERDERP